MHAWSYARTQRELLLCNGLMCMVAFYLHSSSSMVVWTRMWVCGGAAFLSRAGLHATLRGAV